MCVVLFHGVVRRFNRPSHFYFKGILGDFQEAFVISSDQTIRNSDLQFYFLFICKSQITRRGNLNRQMKVCAILTSETLPKGFEF